ncbi:hypothetical protein QVD17_04108 [Tagetes erecta]|uniref:Uncharacterized protein n=1 Tax=Tagetes erecta TaxID=13708 RepID=A0AAD8PAG5_TARER|nr:hypothetical protein QVD17_04108 [Tagetes erecta]
MLEQLHNVKFLTLSLEIVEVLSSAIELILPQPSPFVNLKSLKIYPDIVHLWEHEPKRVTIMPANLRSYLLDSSSQSTFTKFLREEILEEKLLAELRVLLEKEKDNTETNRARLEQRKAPVQSHTQEIGRNMALIKDTWENLGVELQKRKEKACFIISKLQRFEELLASLPTSNRAKYQPCFSSLRAEADIVLHQITNSMKAQCDENQIRSSVFFCEPATTLESSS